VSLSGCIPAETGIDHTVLTGTITIPPVSVEEGRGNETIATAQGLGPDDSTALTYRSVIVSGKASAWGPNGLGEADGDPDYYAFSPVADGTFTIGLGFTTASSGGDSAAATDADVFLVEVIDLAQLVECADSGDTGSACVPNDGLVFTGTTDGTGGAFTTDVPVTAGGHYVLHVVGLTTDDEAAELPYTLTLSGSAPGDSTILVGAYAGADPAVGEHPLGGTTGAGWTYDPATYTWTGTYTIMWIKGVTPAPEDTDTDDLLVEPPTVQDAGVEGFPTKVNLRGGTLSTLDASPAAGALYATASIEADVTGSDVAVADPIVLDGVFPKVVGVEVAETLPDTTLAEIDLADYSLVADTLVAQDVGMLSGLGYVDIVSGTSVLDPSTSGWNGGNDSDAYAFTVPTSMYVRMSGSWPDSAADLDFGIWYADPDDGLIDLFSSWGDSYCLTGANPELCESVVTLEPDTTYYLVALGYLGTDEQPYSVELEWVAP
jgi:hypothetical protein